jgi:hypothetical protein
MRITARHQDWYLVAGVTVAAGIIVGLITLRMTPPTTTEYLQWQEKHEAWKRGDVIGVRLETPKRRWYPDPVTGEMMAD